MVEAIARRIKNYKNDWEIWVEKMDKKWVWTTYGPIVHAFTSCSFTSIIISNFETDILNNNWCVIYLILNKNVNNLKVSKIGGKYEKV